MNGLNNIKLFKNPKTGDQQIVPGASLKSAPDVEAVDNGGIKTVQHDNTKQWDIAQKRHDIIKPLLKDNRTKSEVLARALEFRVSANTIYHWIKRFETTGTISSLIPQYKDDGL